MHLKPDDKLLSNDHFRFDTVDITRAALTQIFMRSYADVKSGCTLNGTVPALCGDFKSDKGRIEQNNVSNNLVKFFYNSKIDLNCAREMDLIIINLDLTLRCDENFMVGIRERRAMDAGDKGETEFMRFNYRNMLTLWGPGNTYRRFLGELILVNDISKLAKSVIPHTSSFGHWTQALKCLFQNSYLGQM